MTTIVEMPLRFNTNVKKVNDRREEFYSEIKSSQFITFTVEYFADCFADDPRQLKAVNVRLYQVAQSQRPQVNHYAFTWEDVPRAEEENWSEFRSKVHRHLKKFLRDIKNTSNAIEGKML